MNAPQTKGKRKGATPKAKAKPGPEKGSPAKPIAENGIENSAPNDNKPKSPAKKRKVKNELEKLLDGDLKHKNVGHERTSRNIPSRQEPHRIGNEGHVAADMPKQFSNVEPLMEVSVKNVKGKGETKPIVSDIERQPLEKQTSSQIQTKNPEANPSDKLTEQTKHNTKQSDSQTQKQLCSRPSNQRNKPNFRNQPLADSSELLAPPCGPSNDANSQEEFGSGANIQTATEVRFPEAQTAEDASKELQPQINIETNCETDRSTSRATSFINPLIPQSASFMQAHKRTDGKQPHEPILEDRAVADNRTSQQHLPESLTNGDTDSQIQPPQRAKRKRIDEVNNLISRPIILLLLDFQIDSGRLLKRVEHFLATHAHLIHRDVLPNFQTQILQSDIDTYAAPMYWSATYQKVQSILLVKIRDCEKTSSQCVRKQVCPLDAGANVCQKCPDKCAQNWGSGKGPFSGRGVYEWHSRSGSPAQETAKDHFGR